MVTAIVLPELYWVAFDKPIKTPYVQYSCILNDFTIYIAKEESRTDKKGNSYTREEYEATLPLMYTRQLMIDQRMPDTIRGIEADMHIFGKARSFSRIRPVDFQAPLPELYPLIESESGRANLEFPEDFFRINWRMEFINANTNEIDEAQSRKYSAPLYHEGFKFPAKLIAGIPSTRKSCDEGYLVVDSEDQLFHVKKVKDVPFIQKVTLPEGLTFKHISCVDFKDKLYYAYLISEDNGIYILTQDDYELVRLPIEDYIAEEHQLKIQGDYFNYNITLVSDSTQKTYATDKDFNILDTYTYSWLPRQERMVGKISASLFPFELSLTSGTSRFISLYPTLPKGFVWIISNFVFVLVQLVLIKKRGRKLSTQLVDIVMVAITGIFGFITVNAFPNKFGN